LRIRKKGSDGGHNGLKSIIEMMATQDFNRLRFGIGNDFPKGYQVDFVLGEWSLDEKKILPERIEIASKIILSFGTIGIDRTMNLYNNK
jgi:PTH1 family peptidyl-tRNA hydrolase